MLRLDSAEPLLMLQLRKQNTIGRRIFKSLERDNYLRQAATALAVEKYENSLADAEGLGQVGDENTPLMNFLQFLIDHQEEIKALIEMIMSLFAGDEK